MLDKDDFILRKTLYERRHKKNINQPLIENIDNSTSSTESPSTSEDNGIAYSINKLIIDEWEAISGYNDAIILLQSLDKYPDEINVLKDIVAEENIHVGQLQKIMEKFSPNVAQIHVGEQEAEEHILDK